MRGEAALGGLIVYYISYTLFPAAGQSDQAGSVWLILDFLHSLLLQTVGGGSFMRSFSQIPLGGPQRCCSES